MIGARFSKMKKPFHSSELVARLGLLLPTEETKAAKPNLRAVPAPRPLRRRPAPVPAFAR